MEAGNDGGCVLATGGFDNQIRLWRVATGTCHHTYLHQSSQVNTLAIAPDRTLLAAGGQTQIRFYDLGSPSPNPMTVFEGHRKNVVSLGFSEDPLIMYTASEDKTVKLWDPRKSRGYQCEFKHQSAVNSVVLLDNKTDLVSADQEGRIARWDLRENRCVEHLIPEPDVPVRCVCAAPNGKMLAASNDEGNLYIWDTTGRDFRPVQLLAAHPSAYVLFCTFSHDSRKLATTSSDGTCRVFDLTKGCRMSHKLTGHGMWVWSCAFSGDDSYMVTCSSDKTAMIWNLDGPSSSPTQDGPKLISQPVVPLRGHQRAVTALALDDTV